MSQHVTADLQKKHLFETQEQSEYERQLDFFESDTHCMFERMNDMIERIREIEKQYDFDLTEDIKEKVKEIFDLELKD